MPTRRCLPLAAAILGGLLSACSSGGGSSVAGSGSASSSGAASSSASASTSGSSSGTASSGTAATAVQLQKIVIQAGDLPSSYIASPATPDGGSDTTTAQLEACTGVKGAQRSHRVSHAQSSNFRQGTTTLSSSFSSYQSQGDVDADVAQLQSPQINRCLNSVLADGLAKAIGTTAKVTATSIKLTPGPNGGPSNVAGLASGSIAFTVKGQSATVYLGVAFVTGPQLDGTLTYVSLGKPLDDATATSVLTAVARRAANP